MLNSAKNDFLSYPARVEGLVDMYKLKIIIIWNTQSLLLEASCDVHK